MIAGTQTIYWSGVPSAYGTCNVLATEKGVCWTGTPGTLVDEGIVWVRRRFQVEHIVKGQKVAPLQQAVDELRRYLEGEALQFSCPLDLRGTIFQVAVWQELLRIPYGQTRSYLEIARAIGQPTAV
ncbi:MAG: methylated-DNA--[protein]-cysteine S-methyltransferase, partial [Ktedonobacteraceae bacterium]|nr:methylated-DNA--[protein]-cysteine S-methyltransferase [Ktedonobacteraceae bacterium]